MQGQTNTVDSLRRVFYEGFVAQDIAEPIASFDTTADIDAVGTFMVDRPHLRDVGAVLGNPFRGDLAEQSAPLEFATQVHPQSSTGVI